MTSLREASHGRPIDHERPARRLPRPARGRGRGAARLAASTSPTGPTASSRPAASRCSIAPDGASATVRAARRRRRDAAPSSSTTPRLRTASRPVARRRDPPRPPGRPDRPGRGCNAMARPALRKVDTAGGGRSPASCPPRPRSVAGGRGPGGPGAVRRPVSEVRGPGVQLRGLRARATTTRRRTPRSGRSCPRSPGCPASRSGPTRPTAKGLHVPGLAVPDRPQRRRRAPPARGAAVRRRHSTRPSATPDPTDVERDVVDRDEAAAAWRAVDRLDGDRRRAVVLRFVHEMSTAEIAAVLGRVRGRGAGPHPPRPGGGRARPAARRDGTGVTRARHRATTRSRRSSSTATSTRCSPGAGRTRPTSRRARARPRDRLAEALPRYHPSFRFEEAPRRPAGGGRSTVAAGASIEFPVAASRAGRHARPPWPGPPGRHRRRRHVGGDLAGRRGLRRLAARPATDDPMARAVRAVARTRLA